MKRQRGLIVAIALGLLAGELRAHAEPTSESITDPFKIANIKVEPMGLLYGIFGGEVSFRLTDKWSLGGSYQWFQYVTSGHTTTAQQYGGSVNWFALGRKPGGGGPYVRGFFQLLPVEVTTVANDRTVTNDLLGAILGYQWMWSNGLNTNLGAGVTFQHALATQTASATFQLGAVVNQLEPTFEWTIGWAF
jgi:hypothetical protein